jgi:hypothetical protein
VAQTYSQSITGVNAGARYNAVKTVQVGDADAAGNALNAVADGLSQQGVMQRGNQILCKNPDGSQSWYTIDAERSVPGGPLVMRAVGP